MSLKALANKVLARNHQRNQTATQPENERNSGGSNEGEKLRLKQDLNGQAREDLDHFFAHVITPRIIDLTKTAKSPNLAKNPIWLEAEKEWNKAATDSPVACDVAKAKTLMIQALDTYSPSETHDAVWDPGWPDKLLGLGPKTIGKYSPCSTDCGRRIWVRYGNKPFCKPCARKVAEKGE